MPDSFNNTGLRPGAWHRISFFWKLMAAFALVVLIGVGGALFVVARSTEAEFRRFAHSGQVNRWQSLNAELSAYYATNGTWEGVDQVLTRGQGRIRGVGGPKVVIVDSEARVVADQTGGEIGQTVDQEKKPANAGATPQIETSGTLPVGPTSRDKTLEPARSERPAPAPGESESGSDQEEHAVSAKVAASSASSAREVEATGQSPNGDRGSHPQPENEQAHASNADTAQGREEANEGKEDKRHASGGDEISATRKPRSGRCRGAAVC